MRNGYKNPAGLLRDMVMRSTASLCKRRSNGRPQPSVRSSSYEYNLKLRTKGSWVQILPGARKSVRKGIASKSAIGNELPFGPGSEISTKQTLQCP